MCSADLGEFIEKYHLDLSVDGKFNARAAFGSHDDADHVYNTPRAWFLLRYFNPRTKKWDGPLADYTPESDDLPWCMVPEKKITIEDVKYALLPIFREHPMTRMPLTETILCVALTVPSASIGTISCQ